MNKENQKQFETEIKEWGEKYLPKITEIDVDDMYREHIKNHPDLQQTEN